ncbi:MAG: tetratricopeptide repeat protein [Treponema sp.]|nr:tetratricopeptide repeat protein [Treponema sp.]
MLKNKNQSGYGLRKYRFRALQTAAIIFVVVLVAAIPILYTFKFKSRLNSQKKELLSVWEAGDFTHSYEISKNALLSKPMDFFFLTINGFSSFQLGISQINYFDTLMFIDESIISLRKALLLKEAESDGRVFYVLGKAYNYKGREFADLAIKYLEIARVKSYNAADINEYLGLAYAAIGDYRSSIEAFTRALGPESKPTDALLLSIVRSYIALEDYDAAKAYLLHCIDISPDAKSVLTARLLLAEVFSKIGDIDACENLYISILNDTGENAEVRYQLGELYYARGDTTRARSEWRLAYRIDPAHLKARARLN